jgi:hypothetical protein
LPECRYTIIEANLFDDSAAVEPQYGDTGECIFFQDAAGKEPARK